jgi:hypothetical protein
MTMAPGSGLPDDAGDGREVVPPLELESYVPSQSNVAIVAAVQPARSPLGNASMAVLGTAVVLFVALVGVTFVALAFAFPVAVPLIEQQHLPVSADDLALAKSYASFWWAFLAVGIVALAGALVAAVKLVQHLDPAPAE